MSSKKHTIRNKILLGAGVAATYYAMQKVAEKHCEASDIDKNNPYLNGMDENDSIRENGSVYETKVKPVLDQVLSFAGLTVLSPLYAGIAAAIYIDDPGPVFFTQKRVGKDKKFFALHKFRSMRMDTPHDIPTHQLNNPDQYITRVGRVLRKTSLDELPQLWDIFRGHMSIIGPRPALFNQNDLVAERDSCHANDIMPGLTGLAQIKGRDELEIPAKAALDGEYAAILRRGGKDALFQDIRCFVGTIRSVLKHEGVVEGGTGQLYKNLDFNDQINENTAGFDDYGCYKSFHIDKSLSKKVLITGAGSYIGESFADYAAMHYPNLSIDTVDMVDGTWRARDIFGYDTVVHMAGIAHSDVGRADEEIKKKYYDINTKLAIETAQKAKKSGVSQFVFMSSMIVYGDSDPYGKTKVIDEHTLPSPANFYGDSKWQADQAVRKLGDDRFHVAVLRPPMIYGRGSKGNYPLLAKLARILPVFPDVDNQRSMLYIDNFCEFLCLLVLSGERGIYFPQNAEYGKTSDIVKIINEIADRKIKVTKLLNPIVKVASYIPGKVSRLVNKSFGNNVYKQYLSIYDGLDYQIHSFKNSIAFTEDRNDNHNRELKLYKKHVLIISQYFYPEQFRINDICIELVRRGYKVTVITGIPNYPEGKFYSGYSMCNKHEEIWNGIHIIRLPIIPRKQGAVMLSLNYISFVISGFFWSHFSKIDADTVFIYEVSPMTQALVGVWYAKGKKIPCNLYVTDLWPDNVEIITGIHNKVFLGIIGKMVDYIYKRCDHIFTSSKSFIPKINKQGVSKRRLIFWPQYAEDFYKKVGKKPEEGEIPQDGILNLTFAGNIGEAQGLDVLVKAAGELKKNDVIVRFNIIGNGRYEDKLKESIRKSMVQKYFNFIPRKPAKEIPKYLALSDAALITLSKSDVFAMTIPAKTQSCMACGIPIFAAADGEVQQIVREAQCGYYSDAGDGKGLALNIMRFAHQNPEERKEMSDNAIKYYSAHFDKRKLINQLERYL